MATNPPEQITIEMPSMVVSGIDGELDNASQTAFEEGDEDLGFMGVAIRESIGSQVNWSGDTWPPDEQALSITLSRAQWLYIVSSVNASTPIYDDLGDVESAGLGRRAAAAIEPHLT